MPSSDDTSPRESSSLSVFDSPSKLLVYFYSSYSKLGLKPSVLDGVNFALTKGFLYFLAELIIGKGLFSKSNVPKFLMKLLSDLDLSLS